MYSVYLWRILHCFSATSLDAISKMLLISTRSMKMLLVAYWHGSIVLRQRREGNSLNLLLQTPKLSRDNWKRPRHEKETHTFFIIHSYVIAVKIFTSLTENTEWKSCSHTHSSEVAHCSKGLEGHHSIEQTLHIHVHSFQNNTQQHEPQNHVKVLLKEQRTLFT